MATDDEYITGPIPPEADGMQERINAKMGEIARWLETRGLAEDERSYVWVEKGNRIRCVVKRVTETGSTEQCASGN